MYLVFTAKLHLIYDGTVHQYADSKLNTFTVLIVLSTVLWLCVLPLFIEMDFTAYSLHALTLYTFDTYAQPRMVLFASLNALASWSVCIYAFAKPLVRTIRIKSEAKVKRD